MDSAQFKSDEFRMLVMKVQPCSKRFCHDWTVCPFAHPGEKARRRDPRVFNYTGIACPEMKKDNSCPRGDSCPYAHNVFEYWLHPTRYRTQLCNDGERCRRHVCFFAHSLEELRVPPTKPFVSPEALAQASLEAARGSDPASSSAGQQDRASDAQAQHAQDLAAQLAWLQLGGGLDHAAPPAPTLAHRASLADSLGDGRSSFSDRPQIDPATASYLAQLAQERHLQQLQQQQHMPGEERQFSGERPPRLDDRAPTTERHASPHNAQPEDFAWTERITRARSKSDPLHAREADAVLGLMGFPHQQQQQLQQQQQQQQQAMHNMPASTRVEGRSLDAALRALQSQHAANNLYQASQLYTGLPTLQELQRHAPSQQQQHPQQQQRETSFLDQTAPTQAAMPNYPPLDAFFPQQPTQSHQQDPYLESRGRSSSFSGHSGSGQYAGSAQGHLRNSGWFSEGLHSHPLPDVSTSASYDTHSGRDTSSHSHSQDSPRAMGMLWGSRSSLGSQPRRSSLAPQDQQLPPSASGHPLRTSFQQQSAYAPDPAWERDRQAHLRLSNLTSQHAAVLRAEQEAQSRSSMSSSRTSGEKDVRVPDYSSWLVPSAGPPAAPPGYTTPQAHQPAGGGGSIHRNPPTQY